MASGKLSPRQKMINMMYLVLTALLAMNVSKEILNAFKTVNKSLNKTVQVMSDKNKETYSALEDAMKDPQSREKAAIWKPVADQIAMKSNDLNAFLEQYKNQIMKESGLVVENGENVYKYDDLDAATRLMINNKEGSKIYNRMIQYRKEVLEILKNANVSPENRENLNKAVAKFEHSLPINMEIPEKTQDGTKVQQNGVGWTEINFHMTPAVAAITILTKLQTDVKNSEGQLSDYCLNQIGKVKLIYDKFAAVASANTTYCMPGETIEVSAGIGAFNSEARPTFVINGSSVPLGADGMALYKFQAKGPGVYQIPVSIGFTTPDGLKKTENRVLKYTVGQPSGAALMLDKMNVFYIGLDNPISVSSGTGDEKTKLIPSGGGITLTKNGPGKYIVRATQVGTANITINSDGKTTTFPFRIKRVPDPVCTVGGTISNGKQQKGIMAVQQGLVAKLENFDFDAKFDVLSYEYTYIPRNADLVNEVVQGPRFSNQLTNILKNMKPKDVISFENVKVKGPDGSQRKIGGLSVTII